MYVSLSLMFIIRTHTTSTCYMTVVHKKCPCHDYSNNIIRTYLVDTQLKLHCQHQFVHMINLFTTYCHYGVVIRKGLCRILAPHIFRSYTGIHHKLKIGIKYSLVVVSTVSIPCIIGGLSLWYIHRHMHRIWTKSVQVHASTRWNLFWYLPNLLPLLLTALLDSIDQIHLRTYNVILYLATH